jgi:hypothetical protein
MQLPPKGKLTPLWIIALFVSFAEAISVGALIATEGDVQLLLTYFVILFPTGVALAFFVILYFKPKNFYAPGDYRDVKEMKAFGLGQSTLQSTLVTKKELESLLVTSISKADTDKETEVRIMKSVQEESITVDPTPLLGPGYDIWQFPYKQFQTVQQLLDTLYSALPKELVKPFSYGMDWILKDKVTGNLLDHIGRFYRLPERLRLKYVDGYAEYDDLKIWEAPDDNRTLQEAGIMPAAALSIIRSPSL